MLIHGQASEGNSGQPLRVRPPQSVRLLQQDVLVQFNAVVGLQRSFAETVNAYIEKKLAEE